MKKLQCMSIHQFLNGQYDRESIIRKVQRHIGQNKSFYISVAGYSVFFLFCGIDGSAMAASGIDHGMSQMYKKVLSVGKWILIIKGGIDVIQSVTTGEFEMARKRAIGYILSFLILLGLPWAFGEVERLFDDLETGAPGK